MSNYPYGKDVILLLDYLYDASFDGLLSCIYEHYYSKKCSGIYSVSSYQGNLLSSAVTIETDYSKSEKVYQGIIKRISSEALRHVYYVYLSNDYNKGTLILNYLALGFKIGSFINNYHTNNQVKEIHALSKKVSFEYHRFLGLLRFSDLGKFLYAEITPDHDILPLLADHFCDRFQKEHFIIHDKQRKKALIYAEGHYQIESFDFQSKLSFSNKELLYRDLWKNYFKSISIKERENPKLQRQFMPHRYWKNLSEV